jgi:hypothetical protein
MTIKDLPDLVICKCGVRYRSSTECKTVDGAKVVLTVHPCTGCGRKDNWQLLTTTKAERVPSQSTQEEDIAWQRLDAERQTKVHVPKFCYDDNCAECKSLGYRDWAG